MSLRNDDQVREDDQFLTDYLEVARQKFEEGNKSVLLMAMHQCLVMNKPVPEWLRRAFIEAYQSATAFNIRSWDEAFGAPNKGAHLRTRKGYAELRYGVAMGVALREWGDLSMTAYSTTLATTSASAAQAARTSITSTAARNCSK